MKHEIVANLSRTGYRGIRVKWTDKNDVSVYVDVEVPRDASEDDLKKLAKESKPEAKVFKVEEKEAAMTQEEWIAEHAVEDIVVEESDDSGEAISGGSL